MSVRDQYRKYGVDAFYENHSYNYYNPHIDIIRHHLNLYDWKGISVLDLGCGRGEVTKEITQMGCSHAMGCDPYMSELYTKETGMACEIMSFKDIVMRGMDMRFDRVVCSFSLHLCMESMLPTLLHQLSLCADELLVISPNKKPNVRIGTVVQEYRIERVISKLIRMR